MAIDWSKGEWGKQRSLSEIIRDIEKRLDRLENGNSRSN